MNPKSARALILSSILLVVLGLVVISPTGRIGFLVIATLLIAIPVVRGPGRMRISGCVVLLVIAAVAIFSYPAFRRDYGSYAARAQMQAGLRALDRGRAALESACREDGLDGDAVVASTLSELQDAGGPLVRSLTVDVPEPKRARIQVVFEAMGLPLGDLGSVIEAGSTIAYVGTCAGGEMHWSVSGTVPSRFLPRR